MTRTIIAVAALGTLFSWLLYSGGHTSTRAQPATAVRAAPGAAASDGIGPDPAVEKLERQVASLHSQLDATRARASNPQEEAAAVTLADSEQPAVPDVADMTPEQITAYERDLSTKVAAEAEARLNSEPSDPTWSGPTQQAMTASVAAIGLAGARFQSAECRQSMCRVVLDHDGLETVRAFGPELFHRPPFNTMSTFMHYDDDRIVVYALRPDAQK